VCFVDCLALGARSAAQVASDCDSDGDSHREPDGDVTREDAGSGANSGAEGYAKTDLCRRVFHISASKTN
jgi:hypothetical protein